MNIWKGATGAIIILLAINGCQQDPDELVKTAKGDRVKREAAESADNHRQIPDETDDSASNEDQ
jgi:hypothetical protein